MTKPMDADDEAAVQAAVARARDAVRRFEWTFDGGWGLAMAHRVASRTVSVDVLRARAAPGGWTFEHGCVGIEFATVQRVTLAAIRDAALLPDMRSLSNVLGTSRSRLVEAMFRTDGPPRLDAPPTDERLIGRVADMLALPSGPARDAIGTDLLRMLSRHDVSHGMLAHHAGPAAVAPQRLQASTLYPHMASTFHQFPDVVRLVDARRPFEAELAARLMPWAGAGEGETLSVAGLRRTRTMPPRRKDHDDHKHDALWLAARLPVEWLPDDAESWSAFGDVAEVVRSLHRRLGLDPMTLVAPGKGDWVGHLRSLEGRVKALHGMSGGASSIGMLAIDAARHAGETLVTPFAIGDVPAGDAASGHDFQERCQAAAAACLFDGRALGGVLDAAARHHASLSAIEEAVPQDAGMREWPVPFETLRMPNGLDVVPLANAAQLVDEGRSGPDAQGVDGLSHCISTYAKDCIAGGRMVLSVRRPKGAGFTRLATALVSVDGAGFDVEEVSGFKNREPDVRAREAVGTLAGMVASGSVVIPEAVRARRDSWEVAMLDLRFDHRDPGKLRAALDAWRAHLVPGVAALDTDTFAALVARHVAIEPEGQGHTP